MLRKLLNKCFCLQHLLYTQQTFLIFAEVNVHLRETICDVTDHSQSFTKVMLVELEYYLERFSNQAFTKRLTVIN